MAEQLSVLPQETFLQESEQAFGRQVSGAHGADTSAAGNVPSSEVCLLPQVALRGLPVRHPHGLLVLPLLLPQQGQQRGCLGLCAAAIRALVRDLCARPALDRWFVLSSSFFFLL